MHEHQVSILQMTFKTTNSISIQTQVVEVKENLCMSLRCPLVSGASQLMYQISKWLLQHSCPMPMYGSLLGLNIWELRPQHLLEILTCAWLCIH